MADRMPKKFITPINNMNTSMKDFFPKMESLIKHGNKQKAREEVVNCLFYQFKCLSELNNDIGIGHLDPTVFDHLKADVFDVLTD